jgi:soluble lytic murein transglycosylase
MRLAAVLPLALALSAQDLATLGRAYRLSPTPRTREALETFARRSPAPLAHLALGAGHRNAKDAAAAADAFRQAGAALPALADYAAYSYAAALADLGHYEAVPATLVPVYRQQPPSPFAGRALVLSARADRAAGRPGDAVVLLSRSGANLPQPEADLELGKACEEAGDLPGAAAAYQRVYYGYPVSDEAAAAEPALRRLAVALGERYPAPAPATMLARAWKMLEARRWIPARHELEALAPRLAGAERDLARVRIGAADVQAGRAPAAFFYLRSLEVADPEADAERLHYLLAAARRMRKFDAMDAALADLRRRHPASPWRLEALVHAGNEFLLSNDAARYEPLYRECAAAFPRHPRAAYCHWKIAFLHYVRREQDAGEMLRAHLERYPASDNVPAALYFLARLEEGEKDLPAARALYDTLDRRFPNSYYAMLGRERLADPAVAAARAGAPPPFRFPDRPAPRDWTPAPETRQRIDRARLLASAGLDDWAELELRFALRTRPGEEHILGLALATLASERGAPDAAAWHLRTCVPDYLYQPLAAFPDSFWKLAFPLRFREDVEKYARQHALDPFQFAALVRQESAFNPRAVSPANALGLAQVLPGTGRELSRVLGIKGFRTEMLFVPAVNLRLGSFYLRRLIDSLNGSLEAALASYNAGKTRATEWLQWREYREPAEFVETIPFTETREYVQIVMRNADVYRKLYGVNSRAAR